MTQPRSHAGDRSKQAEPVELGNEPPLSVDGGTSGFVDRRRVSVQWLAGTILTALSGAALMGGAVFTSLDGETNFASLPERVEGALRGALRIGADKTGSPHKGNRLATAEEPSFARQVIRVSTVARVGNHEVVRVRPFVRIAGNLSLTASGLSASIPPFNPQRLLAESAGGDVNAEEAAAPEPDAEVAFVMRDLSSVLPQAKSILTTPDDEVMARVREAAAWLKKSAEHGPVAPDITGIKLAYAGVPNGTNPYAGFDVRIVPENITLMAKTAAQATGGNPVSEKTILVKKGDTVAGVLHELGATPEEIGAITGLLGSYGRDGGIKEGQKLRILLSPDPESQHLQPVRVMVADDNAIRAVAALADTGKYVAVDPRNIDNEISDASDDTGRNASPTGVTLYQSVYETALRNNVPRPIIDDLIRMYSFDVDFDRKVQAGDYFEVLYAGNDEASATDSHNEVLFAMLTVGGETKKLYRFQSPDDGLVDYYDESGKSAKKFLVRKPVAAGIMRSGFGLRGHPILGYVKMHTGVDWAAPMGTPVYAAGNGVIEKEGWESGYGKFVLIRHTNGYETAYGHMSAYARGTQEGAHVRQGQVIGFIGSTGLSTGSHLHFEIRINGRFVDPMRVKLPRGRELHQAMLAAFEQERDRIDNILARKPARVAAATR